MLKVACMVFFAFWASSGLAETYKKTYSKGNWALYRVDGTQIRAPNGKYEAIDGLCLAAFQSSKAKLQFWMAPAAIAAQKPHLRDYIWVQISAETWNFRNRNAPSGLSVGISSYTERRAKYEGSTIGFGVPNFQEPFGIFLMFAGTQQSIDVTDRKGTVIAKFPANGFAEVRDKLFSCAGV